MDHYGNLGRISHSLDAILNTIIGPEVYIKIRRTTTNLRDNVQRIQCQLLNSKNELCYSGSKAEGLRFKSSDEDWMSISRMLRVIPSECYTAIYDSNTTLLLMENEMTKPGFTLLKLIKFGETTNQNVSRSIEHILNGCYLSCKRWRELHTQTSLSQFTHGPCASGIHCSMEFDFAYCLRCDTWPPNAQNCIRRLHQSVWPSHATILSIVNDGVLFVPIGAKQSIFENTEWRMSFSLAEKKLIHVMNHTQFLCYGLLKIFLKEAVDVNSDIKGLLCSYFLKTALFWEITTSSNQWNPSTLLSCFWKCFQRLLQWVSCSYCPNFFIPQNNMFGSKIEGRNRDKLLQHLRTLYCQGYKCLLKCQSLSHSTGMSLIMHREDLKLVSEQADTIKIALEIIKETDQCLEVFVTANCSALTNIKCILMHQFANILSSHERFLLKTWLHQYLTDYSISSNNSSAVDGSNRSYYSDLTRRMNILGRCRTDSVSHFLYQAMLCYNNGRYTQALRLVQQSKAKISDLTINWYTATEKHFKEVGLDHLPIETVLLRHCSELIKIDNDENIPELYLERRIHHMQFNGRVLIHPLVCAFFLQYLCQQKLSDLREADDALYELSLLVQLDDEHHTEKFEQATSWQILGICQQMSGDDRAACRSFMTAQQHFGSNLLKFATCVRLAIVLVKHC